MVDFSMFYLPTYRPGFSPNLHSFYDEMTETVKLCDRLGWQRVLSTEHHFHYYGGAVPNPAVLMAAWARETKTIRLAAGVSLLPLRHPLQVAEDYALVDHLSNGRFDMGVSRGFVPHEFEAFGTNSAETADRVAEGLEIVKKFWRGEPFEFQGRFHSFKKIQPWPRPYQKEIPIWVATSNDLSGFERAGRGGYRLMMNQYPMSQESARQKHDVYKEAYAKAGHDPAKRRSMMAFAAYIADTEEEAIDRAKAALQEHAHAFMRCKNHDEWNEDHAGDVSTLLSLGEGNDYRDVFRRRTLVCTPTQAAERIAKYMEQGFTEISFMVRFAGIGHSEACTTIERLSKEVRPMLPKAA